MVAGADGVSIAVCVQGGAVDGNGVCIEHGQTGCVIWYTHDENCLGEEP